MKKLAIVAAAALALPTAAHAAVFMNGSFEVANVGPGSFITLNSGSTTISGWTTGAGTVDYIGSYWQAGEGERSLDLSGGTPGSISQTFDTVSGQTYDVSFLMSGNPDGPPPAKVLDVTATGNATQTYNFVTGANTLAAMGWVSHVYTFTATGTSTTLTFANASESTAYGPALDNVAVVAVPEPASWALMIAGFGLLGGALRRRTVRAVQNMA